MLNQQKVKVIIDKGKHTTRELPKMPGAIEEVLQKAGFFGNYKVLLGANIRGSKNSRRVNVCNLDPKTFGILLKVQAEGKESKHECVLYVPAEHKDNAREFVRKLRAASLDEVIEAVEPAKLEETQASIAIEESPEVVNSSKRCPMAKLVFKDEGLLKVSLQMLSLTEAGMDNKSMIKKISELDLACSPQGALKYFLQEELLSAEVVSIKKSIIRLTEKGQQMIGKPEVASDEELLSKLRVLGEKSQKYNELSQQLEAVLEEEKRLAVRTLELQVEREKLEQQLNEMSNFSVEFEKVLQALNIKK